MIRRLFVCGPYWHDNGKRTELGVLMERAKRDGDEVAAARLAELLARSVRGWRAAGGLDVDRVVAVPPAPRLRWHPVPLLAQRCAEVLETAGDPCAAMARKFDTANIRDTEPDRRRDVAAAAGYTVMADVAGEAVVLVDDVVVTSSTLNEVAGRLVDAGAASVDAVVVARSRRR